MQCLLANSPHKAGEFAGNRNASFVNLQASSAQGRKTLRQPQLRLPRHRADLLWQFLLALQCFIAYARLESVVPGRLRQQAPCVRVASLGNATPAHAHSTGMFARNQTKVAHQFSWVLETGEVPNLGHQSYRGDLGHPPQCLKRSHHRRKTPVRDAGLH